MHSLRILKQKLLEKEIIKMAKDKLQKVTIKLTKSLIGVPDKQIKVVRALGLKKTNDVVEHFNSATIMGMVNKVPHLVEVVSE